MEWSAGGGFFFRQIVRDMVCNMRLNLGVREREKGVWIYCHSHLT